MVDIDRLLTVAEAAKLSSVLSEGEVRARIDDGRIFVLIDHLETYLEARGRRLARLDQTK